jgi:hypothetical protein
LTLPENHVPGDNATLVDRFIRRIRNNRAAAAIIVAGKRSSTSCLARAALEKPGAARQASIRRVEPLHHAAIALADANDDAMV